MSYFLKCFQQNHLFTHSNILGGGGAGQGLAPAYYPAFRFGAKPVTRSPERAAPAPGCSQDPRQLLCPSCHLPQLIRCQCPIWSPAFQREERGPQRHPERSVQVVCGPMREESLQAREHGFLPSFPVPALGPGSGIETDRALSRQKMDGPGGREGGAGGERRGRETA